MGAEFASWPGCAFWAFPEKETMLQEELQGRFGVAVPPAPRIAKTFADDVVPECPAQPEWFGPLLYVPNFKLPDSPSGVANPFPYWAQSTLVEPMRLRFDSAGDAAKAMRSLQRNWASRQYQSWRRSELIVEKLPFVSSKPKRFPFDLPHSPMGQFTLLNGHTALLSSRTADTVQAGEIMLVEDHDNPPSRAYMKLQEGLLRHRSLFGSDLPGVSDRCLDAGACPGGWTWVLRTLGADVHAVDRSALAPELMRDAHVVFQSHDAFTLAPEDLGAFEWVVSDVICYPGRLLEWVKRWIGSGLVENMICTIKLQGGTDWGVITNFAEIANSHIRHLNANKHELTWMWRKPH